MNTLFSSISLTSVLPVLTLVLLLYFFITYWHYDTLSLPANHKKHGKKVVPQRRQFTLPQGVHPLSRKDALPVIILTVLYAITAFWQLGSTTNPQSFYHFEEGNQIVLTFDTPCQLSALDYYAGLGTGYYTFEVNEDGNTWYTLIPDTEEGSVVTHTWASSDQLADYSLAQTYLELFKWTEVSFLSPMTVTQIRLTGHLDGATLRLGELALYDESYNLIIPTTSATPLFDESATIPESSTWFNSTYFDEIYHARTALEHLENVTPYEVSHPPLGKLILSIGISLFGMTPFGWRFMGTLVGVLMVPILYIFLKNLFGKRPVAICGTILLATEFMHLAQTRIATIDSYAVFFILLMYYFMYRWLALPWDYSLVKSFLPLFLSGLFFGIGVSCKWTVLYGGVGLALLFFFGLYLKYRNRPLVSEQKPALLIGTTLGFCVLFFVIIPLTIYTLSYLPYLWAYEGHGFGALLSTMWDNQVFMFTYHSGVNATHPYSSSWYEWILNIRPILYYLDYGVGTTTAFGGFFNPVLCWGGLLAMVTLLIHTIVRRCTVALFLLVGYLSQLVPWMFVSRVTFAYHYFPSSIFLVLAMGYVFNRLLDTNAPHKKTILYVTAGYSTALYFLFYPVLVGITVPSSYGAQLLKWFPSWPF